MMNYKPSDISKSNEYAVKAPLIEEYNTMGAKFDAKKISQLEWDTFKAEWMKRFNALMFDVVKNRIYVQGDFNG